MTDSPNEQQPNENLERLVALYEEGVAERETSDIQPWLNARSEIEAQWDELTDEQLDRVEIADGTLLENAGQVASRLAASGGGSLRDLRAATPRPPEQWWWHLDVLSHVSDYYSGEPGTAKAPPSNFSRILTGVEIIVLVVAIFLLGRNLLPQIIPTPAPTAAPSFTPAPTATLDAAAFDMSTATTFKAVNNVIEVQVPRGWQAAPESPDAPNQYQFTYAEGTANTTVLQVVIDTPKGIYDSLRITDTTVNSPQAALNSLKARWADPQSGVKPGDIRAAKIGKLDGFALPLSVAASAQNSELEVEFRFASLPDGKLAFLLLQSSKDLWPRATEILNKMIDSLVINSQNIPTQTPTPTLHPLRLTQTEVQKQVELLTPTITPSGGATRAATGAATGAATAAATGAATSTPSATPVTPTATNTATTAPSATTVPPTATPSAAATASATAT
jgi:hypothetical protein